MILQRIIVLRFFFSIPYVLSGKRYWSQLVAVCKQRCSIVSNLEIGLQIGLQPPWSLVPGCVGAGAGDSEVSGVLRSAYSN